MLGGYAACEATMPDELGVVFGMASGPDGQPLGDVLAAVERQRAGGRARNRFFESARQAAARAGRADGLRRVACSIRHMLAAREHCHWESQTRSLPALTPGVIKVLISAVSRKASSDSLILIHPFHGAATRVAPDSTAFGLRPRLYGADSRRLGSRQR